jgi:hypothetical protein
MVGWLDQYFQVWHGIGAGDVLQSAAIDVPLIGDEV